MQDKTITITILRGDNPYAEPTRDETTVYPIGQLAVHWAEHDDVEPLTQLTITHILPGLAVHHLPPNTLTFSQAEMLAIELNTTFDFDGRWEQKTMNKELGAAIAKITNRHLQEAGFGNYQYIGTPSTYTRRIMRDD